MRLLIAFALLSVVFSRSMRKPHGTQNPIQLKKVDLFVGVQVPV